MAILISIHGFHSLKWSVAPVVSFDTSLSLSVIYVLFKTEKNLCGGSLIFFFTFSAQVPLNSAILAVQPLEMLSYIQRMKPVQII